MERQGEGCRAALSGARPMACSPLSTYKMVPVIAEARGEERKAAVLPISSAVMGLLMRGALASE